MKELKKVSNSRKRVEKRLGRRERAGSGERYVLLRAVCTENPIRLDAAMESPKLAE